MRINFKDRFDNLIFFAQRSNWFFTIFIFFVILVSSIIVWNDCLLNPRPSQLALDNISKMENDYKKKMEAIKENDKKIKNRINNFNNPEVILGDRPYFKQLVGENYLDSEQHSNYENYNPEIIN
jgi:uncharacterized membrane protein SpoIIM required for sporulation